MTTEETLRRAQGLSRLAYTGLLLLLPCGHARRYWALVERTADEIIGPALALWAELAVDLAEDVEKAMDP